MQPHPALTGLDHVSLLALDEERTVSFYVDVLGLRLTNPVRGRDLPDPPPRVPRSEGHSTLDEVWLGNGRRAFISITRSDDTQPGEVGIGTIHHLALTAASFDALLKWKRWLQYKQVLVYGPYSQPAYQDLVFGDPDGVLIEIATPAPGFAITQDGQDVYSPALETMAPFRDEDAISRRTWPHPVTEIEPEMAIQGLHHVATITSSLQQTDAFYREVLGLPLVRKTVDSDDPEVQRWYWGLDGGRPGALVTAFPIVHPGADNTAIYGRGGPGVPIHYALDAGSPATLLEWVRSLSTAGIEVTSIPAEAGRQAISFHDPDGEVVELVAAASEPAPGKVSGTP